MICAWSIQDKDSRESGPRGLFVQEFVVDVTRLCLISKAISKVVPNLQGFPPRKESLSL